MGTMRNRFFSILTACTAIHSTAWALKPNDAVTPDALGQADLIKGEVPKAWEPGKVYILECWATWCHPCIQAIPHVDGLYDKYKDKGLVVIGVDVWEDAKDKVAAFVQKKGEGMSYSVIHTGHKGSAFDKTWLKAAGVSGIPYAFVVKDGKFLFGTHPGQLSEQAIEGLLAGGDKQNAVVKSYTEANKIEPSFAHVVAFQKAVQVNDVDKMAESLAALEKEDPSCSSLPRLRLLTCLAKKDWKGLENNVKSYKADKDNVCILINVCTRLDLADDAPQSTLKACIEKLLKCPSSSVTRFSDDSMLHVVVSRFQWRTGDKNAAKESAKKAVEKSLKGFEEVFTSYAKSLEAGDPPSSAVVASTCFDLVVKGKIK